MTDSHMRQARIGRCIVVAAGLLLHTHLAQYAMAADGYPPLDIVERGEYFTRYIPDPLGVGGSIVIVLKSPAVASSLSKRPPFQLRVFRGQRDVVQKSAWDVENDCYLFPSQLTLKFSNVRIDPQLQWRITSTSNDWLAHDRVNNFVYSQPYTFVLESKQNELDFVVLQKDHVDAYFNASFQITIDPPKMSLSKEELTRLSDERRSQEHQVMKALSKISVRMACQSVRLQTVRAEDGTMGMQLAEMSPCTDLEADESDNQTTSRL